MSLLSTALTVLSHQPDTFLPLEHLALRSSMSLTDLTVLWYQLQEVPEVDTLTLESVRLCRLSPTAHVPVVDALYRPLAPTKMSTAAGLVTRGKATWITTPLKKPQLLLGKPARGLLWLHLFFNASNRVLRVHALTCSFVQTISAVASMRHLPPSLPSKDNLNLTLVADSPSGLAVLLELFRVRLRASDVVACQHCQNTLPIPWPVRDLERYDEAYDILLECAEKTEKLTDAVVCTLQALSEENRVPNTIILNWYHTLTDETPKDFIFGEPVSWNTKDVEKAIANVLRAKGGFVAWPVLVKEMRARFPYVTEQLIKKCLNRVKQQYGATLFRRTRGNQATVPNTK